MKTINIKGKDYVQVNERIKFFWGKFPEWSINTELVSDESGRVVTKTLIKDAQGRVRSTGLAFEKEGSTFINKTSHLENCETSSVGRALGMLGIGIEGSIATAEEVENAIVNQDIPDEFKTAEELNISHAQEDIIEGLLITSIIDEKHKTSIEKNMSKMSQAKADECILYLNDNQRNELESGNIHSMKQINKEVENKTNDPKS